MHAARIAPLVAVLTLVWGTNWVLFPMAVSEVSVWTFRAVCLLGSGMVLLAVARLRGLPLHVPRSQRLALLCAAWVYMIVWNVGSTYAAVLIPSGQAAVLGFTMPVWATLLAWLFLRERPTPRLVTSVLLAGAGVGLLLFGARGTSGFAPLGYLLGISAGIGWAAGTVILKRADVRVPAIVSTGWQLVAAGVPICALALVFGSHQPFMPSGSTIAVIGYITLVPMALGNLVWFSIVERVPASVSGMSTVLVPIVAMVTGSLVRAEPMGLLEACALVLCALSLTIVLVRR